MRCFDEKYLEIAKVFASMSHCVSHQVGCIFVKDGRILSTGYNGTPSGYKHNCDKVFPHYDAAVDREKHKEFSSMYEIHSEIGAILFAAKNGIKLEGANVYCTVEPCKDCLKALIQLGVKKIVFLNKYDGNDSIRSEQIKFCKDSNVMFGMFNSETKKTEWL